MQKRNRNILRFKNEIIFLRHSHSDASQALCSGAFRALCSAFLSCDGTPVVNDIPDAYDT